MPSLTPTVSPRSSALATRWRIIVLAPPGLSWGRISLLPCRLRRRALDDELVFDGKRSRHFAGAQTGNGLVALGVHHAEQGDPAVLDDDVERIIAERLHAREPPEVHRVKAAAERVPVTPQHASARRVP